MSDEDYEYEATRTETLISSAIMFFIAFWGIIFNFIGILVVVKNPILRNAFGAMCFSHSVANAGVLFNFFVWAAPATYVQSPDLNQNVNKLFGQINVMFWDACMFSHLTISFNRFISIAYPAKASSLFSKNHTIVLISAVWLLSASHMIPLSFYSHCYMSYSPKMWMWSYGDTPCGYIIAKYSDYYLSISCFAIISGVDFTTLFLLVWRRKHSNVSGNDQKKRAVEIRFFTQKFHQVYGYNTNYQVQNNIAATANLGGLKWIVVQADQSVLQASLFFYEIIMFNYVATLSDEHWFLFFTSTFAWEICHCLDGLIVCLFHFKWSIFVKAPSVAPSLVSRMDKRNPPLKTISQR